MDFQLLDESNYGDLALQEGEVGPSLQTVGPAGGTWEGSILFFFVNLLFQLSEPLRTFLTLKVHVIMTCRMGHALFLALKFATSID